MSEVVNIIELTDAALQHIRGIMERRGGGHGFRVSIKQTGCSGYMYQPEIVDDIDDSDVQVTAADGLKIFIAADCIKMIKGTVLDYVKKDLGQYQLQFNNPNAVSACGCGESFHLKEQGDEQET